MKFLFVSPGYPGVPGVNPGSGVGTYVREMALGLLARGHECHVLAWGAKDAPAEQETEGIPVRSVAHSWWPLIERWAPDSRDVFALRRETRRLQAGHGFDWVVVQSEEGIGIGIQREFPDRIILDVHTTLAQMVCHRQIPASRALHYRLNRERRSLKTAQRILAHSRQHAREIERDFPGSAPPTLVPIGIAAPGECVGLGPKPNGPPMFLVVGTPDRRKGLDRVRAVVESVARRFGESRWVFVSRCSEEERRTLRLVPPFPAGVSVEWRSGIGAKDLDQLYGAAAALLHPARYESFGLPLIEAAACRTPVVCTAVGIAPELLAGELSKFLVNADDPEAVAGALEQATRTRQETGRQLRQRYEAEYRRDRMVDRFLDAAAVHAENRWSQAHEIKRAAAPLRHMESGTDSGAQRQA